MILFIMFIFIFTFANELIIINPEMLIISGFICLFFVIMLNSDTVEQALKGYIQTITNELTIKFNTLIGQIFNTNQVLKTDVIGSIGETNDFTNIVIPTNSIYTKITHENANSVKNNINIKDLQKVRNNFRSNIVIIGLRLNKFK